MITRSVTVEAIDELYLQWNDHINPSALYRRALREGMAIRGVDSDELRDLLDRAQEQRYTLEEVAAQTNRFADLQALIADEHRRALTDDATSE